MRYLHLAVAIVFIVNSSLAQKKTTSEISRFSQNSQSRQQLLDKSIVKGISFRSIGPSIMGGRVVDIEVDPKNPVHFYVAFASGGLWETVNNGASYHPLFDNYACMTIGDIAMDWETNTIYIGSGENNSSRSSYAGMGIFKSNDGGKSWQHLGLEATQHIGRIVLHPTDKNTFWVAAIGHLYTANKERGIYKTTDGGKTFQQVLFINENTGVIDLIVNEKNPNVLYAASWERDRKAWNFSEGGKGSGIYKSSDAGKTWSLISGPESGFPNGDGVGRIGLSLCASQPETIYALLDNQFRREEEKKDETEGLTKDKIKLMSKADFLAYDNKAINEFLRDNDFPEKITATTVKDMLREGTIEVKAIAEYLEDANSLLFDTPVVGAELYRSDDGGKTWKKTHDKYLDDLVYTYGYYFGQVKVDRDNANNVYIVAFIILHSSDGGKTFTNINGDNQHVDHHALWMNPNQKGHLINGNDGGINISYDNGKNWIRANNLAVGQFYAVNVDMAKPYNVYGGLQDNGVWYAPSTSKDNKEWEMNGQNPFKTIMGGDGMQVMVDPRDNKTVYTGYQFGNYFRVDKESGEQHYITPKHELGERPLRWNWQSPIWLSEHSSDVLYMGANKVFRSLKQGEDFVAISKDLTLGGKKGDVAYGTISTLHESPMTFGVLYIGTDDGLVWNTKDGGINWNAINTGLPSNLWVKSIRASKFKEGRVYVALSGYTQDNFEAQVYVSENYGKEWKRIFTNLPMENVNVVREDPVNENLIYVGTDHGLYISLNRGKDVVLMNTDLPAVAVHDLVVHPRDKELVVATHGRSIYIANVEHLQQLSDTLMNKSLYVFDFDKLKFSKSWGSSWSVWEEAYEPELQFAIWTKKKQTLTVSVLNEKGNEVYAFRDSLEVGLNYVSYKLLANASTDEVKTHKGKNGKHYLLNGNYTLHFSTDDVKLEKELVIKGKD